MPRVESEQLCTRHFGHRRVRSMAKLLANEKAIHLAKSKHEDLLIDQGTLATPGGSIWIAKAMLGNDAVIMVVNLDSKQVLLVPETITFQYWCKNNILMDLP